MKIRNTALLISLFILSIAEGSANIRKVNRLAADTSWCSDGYCTFTINLTGANQFSSLCMVPYVGSTSQGISTGKLQLNNGAATFNQFGGPQDPNEQNANFFIQLQFKGDCGDSTAASISCATVNLLAGNINNPLYLNTLNLIVNGNSCSVQSTKYCNADKSTCQ